MNLTTKPIYSNRVFVNVGDVIPVLRNNPIMEVNMKVVDKANNVLVCDDGTGFERQVVFRNTVERKYFEELEN